MSKRAYGYKVFNFMVSAFRGNNNLRGENIMSPKKAVKRAMSAALLFLVMLCLALMPMDNAYAHRGSKAVLAQPTDNQADDSSGFTAKDETVYVILDHDGKVLEQRVVNRIYGKGDIKEIRDYGQYSSVKNMEASAQPKLQNGQVIWDGQLLEKGDIYYEGVTDKELPIEVSIKYFLDGVEVDAASLAGKSGNLRIEMEIKNKLEVTQPITYESYTKRSMSKEYEHYVPFLVQVSYPVDLNIFSDIKAEEAVKVVTGKTMNLSFATFPYPDTRVTFEMRGSDIELEPITFTVIPQVPPVPDVDMEDQLIKMLDGVQRIRDGLKQFGNGVQPLISGGKQMAVGKQAFDEGISALVEGCKRLNENSGQLIAGFDVGLQGFNELKEGLTKLAEGLRGVTLGMSGLSGSMEELSLAMDSLSRVAGQVQGAASNWYGMAPQVMRLENINQEMMAIAQKLVREQPEGSDLHKLGQMVIEQNRIIDEMGGIQGLMQSGMQMLEAINALKEGIDKLKEGLETQLIPGIQYINHSMSELTSGAESAVDGMERYQKGQMAYRQGLVEYIEGIGGLNEGLNALKSNLTGVFTGMDSLVKAFERMNEGLSTMDSQGLSEMEEGIIEAIDDMRFAKALKQRMEELANGYRSFMDNEKNRNSSVQFIMRTRGVEREEQKGRDIVEKAAQPRMNLWERLIDLLGL